MQAAWATQESRLWHRRFGGDGVARAAADIVLMTPGLSVIIEAIKESRKIFRRMNSYAIYPIAETLRCSAVHDSSNPDLYLLSIDRGDDCDASAAYG